jgi:hypothetical protein
MKRKNILILLFAVTMCLPMSVWAAVVTFHTAEPTPGPDDVHNFVGASRDANNVGTYDYDTWLNNETTYIADDRPAQGQTFVTGSSEPVYLLTAVWIRHCGYTDSTDSGTANNGTWYSMPTGSIFGVRITDPSASGTSNFVLGSETYTIQGTEENALPTSVSSSANGTGTWMRFVLDTPIVVAPDTTYGFDVVSVTGNSNMFFEMHGIKDDSPSPPGNPYTSGTAYTSGAGGVANNTLTVAPGDRVFLVELVGAPPATASIPYPADKATGVETDPVLSWNAGFESTQSNVYFGTQPDSLELLATITHTQDVERYSYPVTDLAYNQVYYWRVDQVPQTGPEVTGNLWSFTIGTTKASDPDPYINEICVPIDPGVNLNWKAGLDSTESKVYFGSSPDVLELQTTITHTTGVDRYSHQVTGLTNNTDYYWRVDETLNTGTEATGDLWYFRTIPVISVSDPNLVGWWKFDEGPGKAIDWSGLNQHGTVYGDAESDYGYDGNAMKFDGSDDYVNLPIGSTISSLDSVTITTWANILSAAAWQRIFDFGVNPPPGPTAPTIYMYLTPVNGAGVMGFIITTDGGGTGAAVDAADALPIGWHHVAVTIDAATNNVELYLDGAVVATGPTVTLPSDLGDTSDNYLGKSKRWENATGIPDPHLTGSLDDFRIYNYALTVSEIESVMQIDPLRAKEPHPEAGSIPDILNVTPLSWTPGDQAVQSDVYFGTDAKAVADADTSTADIYRGRQDANSYIPPEDINYNQTYYWRIDGVGADATVGIGHVWVFTVADYLLLDDFESYNDLNVEEEGSNRIFLTWTDGYDNPSVNGSTIGYPDPAFADGEHFVETNIVHSGNQSAPLLYDNSTAGYSEVTITTNELAIGSNWAQYDVQVISLWFYGNPDNAITEQLYIKLNNTKVLYDGNPAKLATPQWTQWNIDLSAFGISLSNVTQIGIGLDKTGALGGSGMIFLDDLRLYW